MCNIVYLTVHRGDRSAKRFREALASELRARRITVVEDYSYDLFNFWKRHKTYGIALAFDFYRDGQRGSGLTLNKNCSSIGRSFAYELCNAIDGITPEFVWRDLQFVESDNKEWFKFFNKVSSNTKAVFHLCSRGNEYDWDVYSIHFPQMVKIFADEIVRCLRSEYNTENYLKRARAAKLKLQKD